MGYLYLVLTIIFESGSVILMKLSEGFQHKIIAGMAVLTYAVSFIFLTLALKYLNAGIANATWAGTGTLLVAVLGMLFLKEQITAVQWIFLALIIVGIAGLQYHNPAQ